jgi:hypothetical protein
MISRLILVGVVGVLGVSLPDGSESRMLLTRARTGATACAGHRAAVAFEPNPVDDHPVNRIAAELNRRSECVDIPAAPVVKVAAISPPAATESDKAVERLFAENDVWGEPATEAVTESDKAVDKLFAENDVWSEPATEAVTESDKAVDKLFAENDVWGEPAAEAVTPSHKDVDGLFAENDVWSEPIHETIAPSVPPAAVRRPEFEPIAVVDGASSLDDDLNRQSEDRSTPEDVEPPTIETALSLTRDAALAWMNVLTKTVNAPGHSR